MVLVIIEAPVVGAFGFRSGVERSGIGVPSSGLMSLGPRVWGFWGLQFGACGACGANRVQRLEHSVKGFGV